MTEKTKHNLKNGGFWSVLLVLGAVVGMFGGQFVFSTAGEDRLKDKFEIMSATMSRMDERQSAMQKSLDAFIMLYTGVRGDVQDLNSRMGTVEERLNSHREFINRNSDDIKKLMDRP